jgi:hypothetical protein
MNNRNNRPAYRTYTRDEIRELENWLEENDLSFEFDFPSPGRGQILIIHRNNIVFKKRESISGMQKYSYGFIKEFCRTYLREYKIDSIIT